MVVVIDELAQFAVGHGDQSKQFALKLSRLVALGRAAGLIVIACTQRPSADLIPTHLRSNFSHRIALRCTDRHQSDTILGFGAAANGSDASTIPDSQRGVALIQDEEHGGHIRARCYLLTDDDTRRVVREAVTVRGGPVDKPRLVGAPEPEPAAQEPIKPAPAREQAADALLDALKRLQEPCTQRHALAAAGFPPNSGTGRRAFDVLKARGAVSQSPSTGLWKVNPDGAPPPLDDHAPG